MLGISLSAAQPGVTKDTANAISANGLNAIVVAILNEVDQFNKLFDFINYGVKTQTGWLWRSNVTAISQETEKDAFALLLLLKLCLQKLRLKLHI